MGPSSDDCGGGTGDARFERLGMRCGGTFVCPLAVALAARLPPWLPGCRGGCRAGCRGCPAQWLAVAPTAGLTGGCHGGCRPDSRAATVAVAPTAGQPARQPIWLPGRQPDWPAGCRGDSQLAVGLAVALAAKNFALAAAWLPPGCRAGCLAVGPGCRLAAPWLSGWLSPWLPGCRPGCRGPLPVEKSTLGKPVPTCMHDTYPP